MYFIKRHKFIFCTILFVAIYFVSCIGLYFFEPVSYSAPYLNDYKEYFDMYSYYSKNIDDEFYIKQITADDIYAADNDVRLKYVANTAIAVTPDDVTFEQVASLLDDYEAEICGYIKDVNFYQFEFSGELTFIELDEICQKMTNDNIFTIVIPDYFEEMPAKNTESTSNISNYDKYYYEIINTYDAWNIYYQYDNNVNVGIIDVLVDYNNSLLDVANKNDYTIDTLHNDILFGAEGHGTHVAGIINASPTPDMHGMAQNANLYSYNGINVSTSYWIASLCDMLLCKDIKVVNISMGYNSYISISAQLGDKNAIEYIYNENVLFSEILNDIINKGNEFVICIAAGNSTGTPIYKTPFAYFGYGDKKILENLDLFGIFDSCPEYIDSKYSFFISDSVIDEVADRIITVGCIGKDKRFTYFSNAGDVDIVSPGENIYSTVLNNEFDYMSGTSMASPFVAGVAAMMFTVNPSLDGVQIKELLLSSAAETVSVYDFEYPVLNAGNAVRCAVDE